MSLRLRLTLMLGSAFVLLWALAATWMLVDLRGHLQAGPRPTELGPERLARVRAHGPQPRTVGGRRERDAFCGVG